MYFPFSIVKNIIIEMSETDIKEPIFTLHSSKTNDQPNNGTSKLLEDIVFMKAEDEVVAFTLHSSETNYQSNNGTAKLLEDIVFMKAEDEVVAIILSAIMGSIIVRWEPLPDYSDSTRVSSILPNEENVHDSNNADNLNGNKSTNSLSQQMNVDYSHNNSHLFSSRRAGKTSLTFSKLTQSNREFRQTVEKIMSELSKGRDESYKTDSVTMVSDEEESSQRHFYLLKSLLADQKDKIFGWKFLETNPSVTIVFNQGNRYEGKLSNCRMHGYGKFIWADGSVYEGTFVNGEMTGQGCLQWPDQSWYEGELSRGLRHGLGLFVQDSGFYAGHWWCRLRHGLGAMYYKRNDTNSNYYNGEWLEDCKDGTGLRSYPSGAMYSGEWQAGTRHGLGTMVWTNNDVYSGNWENGKMDGYGEYTWDTFFNNQLVIPQENCYYGNWQNNIRHGNGTLETNLGVVVHGTWKDGQKHGPAEVICSNGHFVYSPNLFYNDCISKEPNEVFDTDSLQDETMDSLDFYKIPVNAANHKINVSFYSARLCGYILECRKTGKTFGKNLQSKHCCISENGCYGKCDYSKRVNPILHESQFGNETEELLLCNVLSQYSSALKVVYIKYAELCCNVKPAFPTVLMRLMLWQLFRDCNLHLRGLSLADFDIIIANNKVSLVQSAHYPYERLQFWQFLHCLIELSWELYGKQCEGTEAIKGILASALHMLITVDILPNAGRHKGNALFKYKNLLSLDATYWFYRGIGEPFSARKLLKNIFVSSNNKSSTEDRIIGYPDHLIHGKNVIGVGGRLIYFPEVEPLIPTRKFTPDHDHPQDLTCFSVTGLPSIFECFLEVCPSIAVNGLIVNMNYKIIFLEFLELLLLCAHLTVRKKTIQVKVDEGEIAKTVSSEKVNTAVEETILPEAKSGLSTAGKTKKSTKKKNK